MLRASERVKEWKSERVVVWNIFFTFLYIGNVTIPTDYPFSEGLKHVKTTNQHLNADASTYRIFGIHKLLYTEAFTQKRFFIETPLHADSFYTEKLRHTHTQLLDTETFTHRTFLYTDALTQTKTLTHRSFSTEKLSTQTFVSTEALRANISTRRNFYTRKLLHSFRC